MDDRIEPREPTIDSASSLLAYARSLEAAWRGGEQTPKERDYLGSRLQFLRGLFRQNRELFDGPAVLALKALAQLVEVDERPRRVLKEVYGYDAFRPGQDDIIQSVLRGRDALGIMPTGAGKSITYQIPARILGGLTLVVSPLIALMKDQVDSLTEVGIRATSLNSSLDRAERDDRIDRITSGEIEVVYLAPEGLDGALRVLGNREVRLIAIDEAHCISQWGHDFRPSYRTLLNLKSRFPKATVLALTATATAEVTQDIIDQLGMDSPQVFRGSFFRPNLRIQCLKKGGERRGNGESTREAILRLVKERRGESGIIYCGSRKATDHLATYLKSNGVRAAAYHAGMTNVERAAAQDRFRDDRVDVMAATIAFGMGIDKDNVRYVIHRDMPRSIEGYYQEIGRAGRDGLPSDCVLFYSWADVMQYERFDGADASKAPREMFQLADSHQCRHVMLVRHFGEKLDPCGESCDVCAAPKSKPSEPERAPQKRLLPPRPAALDPRVAALRALRRELAEEKGIPPYLVWSDRTISSILEHEPRDVEALREVSGLGPKKIASYGEAILEVLRET